MSSLQKFQNIILKYIMSFLELQFFISLMSLPLLIVWGIPISIMSPLANFIFTPILIVFLWISLLAALCIITHVPCSIFEYCLDTLTELWLYLLSFSRPTWLIGFPFSMLYLSIVICIIIILWYIFINKNNKTTVIFLTTCWLFIILIQPLFKSKMRLQQIDSLPLWSFNIAEKTYLIDNGAFCTRKNRFTNIDYTILPKLIYHTGFTTIDTIVFYKPSTQMIKITEQCITQLNCKKFIVTQKGNCYQKMKEFFKNKGITILSIHSPKRVKKSL